MQNPHLILLHPPSVYDFREKDIQYGLIADTIASSGIFEYFPIGFLSISDYLERRGFNTRIVNIAVKMSKSRKFNVEKFIQSLNPMAFGIDLNWLASAQGCLELAKIVKKYHPNTPIILGGLSASYYHRELISYPYVDYVLRGDSTEEPLFQILKCIKENNTPEEVPNLTWKEATVRVNPLSHVPENLDITFNYRRLIRDMWRYRDVRGNLITGSKWPVNFASMLLFCRGCRGQCITCGGSNLALRRKKLALRNTETIASELAIIQGLLGFPVTIYGDIRQGDWEGLLSTIKERKIRIPIFFELFWEADPLFVKKVASASPKFLMKISPETHDEKIRATFGKPYDNHALEKTIQNVLEANGKVALFFMIGLPHQTHQSVIETLFYVESLLKGYRKKYPKKIYPFISPLVPFIDPGSPAFEQPTQCGYKLLFRNLEDHIAALTSSQWKNMLNYETDCLNREQIRDVSYEAAIQMKLLRAKFGIERPAKAKREVAKLEREWQKEAHS